MSELEKQIKELEENINSLQNDLYILKSKRFFTCFRCKRKTMLKNLTLLERDWYDNEPYQGLTYQGTSYIVDCPKCNYRNEAYNNQQLQGENFNKIQFYFRDTKKLPDER